MDYSPWFSSSTTSLNHSHGNSTLSLFDDSPVREVKKVEVQTSFCEAPSKTWFNNNETGRLVEELNRVNEENKRLSDMLMVVCENYNELKRQFIVYMSKTATNEAANVTKKRKLEDVTVAIKSNNNVHINDAKNNVESSSSDEEDSCGKPNKEEAIQAKVTRVAVHTEASDTSLILKDDYQWRKYGQKVTRDNPCPRAYFKCSFAPTCPVKKKVQRSLEDQSMLVATYEGEHNHTPQQQEGSSRVFNVGSVPCKAILSSSSPTVTLDLTNPKSSLSNETTNTSSELTKFDSGEFQRVLAEHMASSLTKDPTFTSALATAISGRLVHQSSSGR